MLLRNHYHVTKKQTEKWSPPYTPSLYTFSSQLILHTHTIYMTQLFQYFNQKTRSSALLTCLPEAASPAVRPRVSFPRSLKLAADVRTHTTAPRSANQPTGSYTNLAVMPIRAATDLCLSIVIPDPVNQGLGRPSCPLEFRSLFTTSHRRMFSAF